MRFSTQQHKAYCGIDLHARTMSLCILNQDGAIMLPQNMQTSPETCRKAIAPYRHALVVAVAGLCTWYGLAALCAPEGIAFVLGHALSMKAIPGGKAKNDTIEAHKIAGLLRGGMVPQAAVSPAAMRAPWALLRRRLDLARQRAARLTHVPHTTRQDTRPVLGKQIAYQANRDGVVVRLADPAGQKRLAVALALIGYDAPLRRDVERAMVKAAQHHHAHALSRLQLSPGQVCQGLRRKALWDLRGQERPRVSHMGLLCSRGPVAPGPSSSPDIPHARGAKIGQEPGLPRAGPTVGPRGLCYAATRGGCRPTQILPRLIEESG